MKTIKLFKKPYKRIQSTFLTWDIRRLTKQFLIIGIVVALIGSFFWYTRLYMTNERRFWIAIENSLSTKSVTRTVVNGGTGNEVIQSQRFAYSPQMASESKVSFDQVNALVETSVVTEGVLFPDAQYSRYVSFDTNQQKSDGTVPSLDSVLGKWEGNFVPADSIEDAKLSYISELVSLVIFGNFDAGFRNDLMTQLRDGEVYRIDFSNTRDDNVEGEDVVVFAASVGLKGYATLLQNSFERAGYGVFPPLDPANYRADSRIPVSIAVSKRNNNVVGVGFGDRQEVYSGYGIGRTIERPQVDYGSGELEAIVQQELQGIL